MDIVVDALFPSIYIAITEISLLTLGSLKPAVETTGGLLGSGTTVAHETQRDLCPLKARSNYVTSTR